MQKEFSPKDYIHFFPEQNGALMPFIQPGEVPHSLFLHEKGLNEIYRLKNHHIQHLRLYMTGTTHTEFISSPLRLRESSSKSTANSTYELLGIPNPRQNKVLPWLIRAGLVQSAQDSEQLQPLTYTDPSESRTKIYFDQNMLMTRFTISEMNAFNLSLALQGFSFEEISERSSAQPHVIRKEFSKAVYNRGVNLDNGLALCLALGIATISYPSKY